VDSEPLCHSFIMKTRSQSELNIFELTSVYPLKGFLGEGFPRLQLFR